jgi:peptide-methionine (R)-S-oxide reductase
MKEKITKSEEEWRAQLTPEEYHITREKGTEPPFTNKYWTETKKGTYSCVCCGLPLFRSEDKFECGCGWPSFSSAIAENHIATEPDFSLGMARTEVHCNRCDAHLGHLFNDGPAPTGLRYCIDSASIRLAEDAPDEK